MENLTKEKEKDGTTKPESATLMEDYNRIKRGEIKKSDFCPGKDKCKKSFCTHSNLKYVFSLSRLTSYLYAFTQG
jgi:hypothetical protein